MRKKTAVLGWGKKNSLGDMEIYCTGKISEKRTFNVQEVVYYKNADEELLAACMNLHYECIIIDFGCSYNECRNAFLRCTVKAVVLSLSDWKMKLCLEFIRQIEADKKNSWYYLNIFGSEETRRELKKTFKINSVKIPFSEDAFTITKAEIKFFKTLN